MNAIKRIIFDNDGVNIDSEHIAMRDMAEFGYTMVAQYIDLEIAGLKENDIYVDYKGMSSNDIVGQLIKKFSLPEDAMSEDYNVPDGVDLYEFLSDLHTKSVIAKFESGALETFRVLNKQSRLFVTNLALITLPFAQPVVPTACMQRSTQKIPKQVKMPDGQNFSQIRIIYV